jgi:hypothetical protein
MKARGRLGTLDGVMLRAGASAMPKRRGELIEWEGVPDTARHDRLAELRPAAEGNEVAERLIRTMKESLRRVRHFDDVAELIDARRGFNRMPNGQWRIERHGFRAPNRSGDDSEGLGCRAHKP